MTSSDQWKKVENYAYLNKLQGRDAVAGWAWEFIRRSSAYHNAYAEFEGLEQKYGQDWRTKQPRDVFEPVKLTGETDNAWKYRAAGMGLLAKPISASQKRARTWQLADMYDPRNPYDKNHIQFAAINPFPAFYAAPRPKNIPAVQAFESLQHDYIDEDTSHLLFTVFDVTRPLNEQIKKLRPVFGKHRKAFDAKRNDYSGQEDQWVGYLQFLDARDADPEIDLVDILYAVGVPTTREDGPHAIASQRFEQAQTMADEGYKGLLFKLKNH